MGGNKGFGAVPKGQKFKPGTIKRLMSYLKEYKVRLTVVVICILISAGASVAASLFLQTLIDDYIGPLLLEAPPNFGGLLQAILGISVVFLAGILASLFYARTMAVIAQSTLKNIRDEMFTKMQTLPIRYFDTRTHGDIMSYYTNDADTLRQMISQSLPNLFSSVVSMIAVLISMIHLSIWLTLIVLVFTAVILMVIKAIAGRSGNFFMKQQRSIADVNGYIEEMVNGQKVVKVFCYEEKAKERFKEKNENLGNTTAMANTLANILMPVTGGLGYVLYVLIAVAGGAMGIAGVTNLSIGGEEFLTLGTIASFLTLSRNFVNPIAQVSQQLNSVIMAMAGASRIFELLDQEPEEDRGTVTLVNAYEDESGQLKECEKRTGTWAWKDGDKLIPMRGKINLKEVDFGYNEDELVLHDITIYAEPGQKVALVGATGAGKTTISDYLSTMFAMEVVEMDQLIAEREGMSISDIFETYGEEYFRNMETNLLIEMQEKKNVIISCGGGVAMRERNVAEMKKNGRVVLLTAHPQTILDRVKDSDDRPLLNGHKNVEYIEQLMEARREKYEAAADIVVDTDNKTVLQICEDLIQKLLEMDENHV